VTAVGGRSGGEEDDGLGVEVEASESHDGEVEIVLNGQQHALPLAEGEDLVVIVAGERTEEIGVDGEEGQVLNVGIVLDRVGDNVVNVVSSLPPLGGDTVESVDEDTTDVVSDGVRSYAVVTEVVADERKLLPEGAQEDATEKLHPEVLVGVVDTADHEREESSEGGEVPNVRHDRCLVEASPLHLVIKSLEVLAHGGGLVALDNANLRNALQVLLENILGVVLTEGVSAISATEGGENLDTSWVLGSEGSGIIYFAINGKPKIISSFVLGDFFKSEFFLLMIRSHYVF